MRSSTVREIHRVALAAAALGGAGVWGCGGAVRAPEPSPVPCSRVALEPAPPWTASAAWNPGETEMLLVDPGRRSLATYGRDGRRLREASPPELAELDFSVPMRLEDTAGGYVLIDKTRVLVFDEALSLLSRDRPFAALVSKGFIDGSFNDVLIDRGTFYGYVDFIDQRSRRTGDSEAEGRWRRGFVRLDARRGKLDFLHELALDEGGEYAAYYVYDRRPYVAELDGGIYVLRFTEPWSVHRVQRRGLRPVAEGAGGGDVARALYAWNGRLYVLTARPLPKEGEEETSGPVLERVEDERLRTELLQALPASARGRHRWTLHEIDPRGGRRRSLRLPSAAERIRLVPGRTFWTAIEETSIPNLGEEGGGTSFLFLPASEVLSGGFSCAEPVGGAE